MRTQRAWRFAASLGVVAAVLAVYRTLLPRQQHDGWALTLLLAILGVSARWGPGRSHGGVPSWRFWDSITTSSNPSAGSPSTIPRTGSPFGAFLVTGGHRQPALAYARAAPPKPKRGVWEIEKLYTLLQAMDPHRKRPPDGARIRPPPWVFRIFECGAAAFLLQPHRRHRPLRAGERAGERPRSVGRGGNRRTLVRSAPQAIHRARPPGRP